MTRARSLEIRHAACAAGPLLVDGPSPQTAVSAAARAAAPPR